MSLPQIRRTGIPFSVCKTSISAAKIFSSQAWLSSPCARAPFPICGITGSESERPLFLNGSFPALRETSHRDTGIRCPGTDPRGRRIGQSLRPHPEFVALFRRLVLDVWKTRKEDLTAQRAAAEKTLIDLKRRKEQLLEAFVFQKAIDQTTYQQHLDKISEGMALAELDRNAKRKDELDLEAVLDFAERVALNATRLLLEADLHQRQRLQALLFPEGLQVTEGGFEHP